MYIDSRLSSNFIRLLCYTKNATIKSTRFYSLYNANHIRINFINSNAQ